MLRLDLANPGQQTGSQHCLRQLAVVGVIVGGLVGYDDIRLNLPDELHYLVDGWGIVLDATLVKI